MYIIGSRTTQQAPVGAKRLLIFGPSPFQHETKELAIEEAKRLVVKSPTSEYLIFQLVTGVSATIAVETKEQEYT